MASFEMRRTGKTAAGIVLVLVAASVPGLGLSQSALAPVAKDERQRQLVSRIDAERSKNGPYSPALIEPWTGLAVLYEEDGRRALAIAAFEQARQVVRANYGLHTVKEAALIRQEIRNAKAGDDADMAWRLEHEMLALTRRHPNDLGIVPMLRDVADERVDVLDAYVSGEFPPQIYLGCYYDRRPAGLQVEEAVGNCSSGDRGDVIKALQREAMAYYEQAIDVLRRNRRFASPELKALEASLIRVSYASHDYAAGKRSYRRLVSYNAANSASWLARVQTFVTMTDWDLLFSQHAGLNVLDSVVERYEGAYDLLERKGVKRTAIDSIFSPKIPVTIPTFQPNPLVSASPPPGSAYIDAAFEITKYGRPQHIEILDASPNVRPEAEKHLVRLIKENRFRPVIEGGRVRDRARVSVRVFPQD